MFSIRIVMVVSLWELFNMKLELDIYISIVTTGGRCACSLANSIDDLNAPCCFQATHPGFIRGVGCMYVCSCIYAYHI